ncbi:MAG: hypothetical protein ACRDS0_20270 [Pseudonocardiaceae bacterium]
MYELNDDDITDQLENLPAGALAAFAELRATLEVAPWSGEPARATNPQGAVRFFAFASTEGSGFVYYLILDDQRRVDLLELPWLG